MRRKFVGRFVFLEGDLESGFKAYGPYDNIRIGNDVHDLDKGILTELRQPRTSETVAVWDHNSTQFPRLLAELRAYGLTESQYTALEDAMDLGREDIDELFERAEDEWNELKAPDKDAEYCDHCGHIIDGHVVVYTVLPFNTRSANAGESGTLCDACHDELRGNKEKPSDE